MKYQKKTWRASMLRYILLSSCVLTLTACTAYNLRHDTSSMSTELNWPDAKNAMLDAHKGTFPNLQSLSILDTGMTKDQHYALIGRPHFYTGFRSHEWDYVFHFWSKDKSVITCQFKVLFDKDNLSKAYYWKAVTPNAVCPPYE